ncbi:MAG: hypothetical protein D6705_13345 [Deltaproteobacteria bacterium]|nr:MAG: hypothetical protein D6705_13345 [Deltaproteobacteria bacterium]
MPVRTVVRWIRRGAVTCDALAAACGAGAWCRSCHATLRALVQRHAPKARTTGQLDLFDRFDGGSVTDTPAHEVAAADDGKPAGHLRD